MNTSVRVWGPFCAPIWGPFCAPTMNGAPQTLRSRRTQPLFTVGSVLRQRGGCD
jgi:hypothetical protein